jgi:hypothetical protein
MGASLSTLGGWTLILCIAGYYGFRYLDDGRQRGAARAAAQRLRAEERQNIQVRKEPKEKAKRQRVEALSNTPEDSDKTAKPKPRVTKAGQSADLSSDDGVDNREFARQLASVKQGTSFSGGKKTDEKKQKSVKQSRAQERETKPEDIVVSAPSSTAGVDADDDQSSVTSPEVTAADAGDVSDMLERPTNTGPSVLRLTDTDKAPKNNGKPAKAPEKVETKKQRQNRQKVEAAKTAREEAEQDRKVKLEAQRRLARISEGRAAKDGSAFMASVAASSAWTSNGVNGKSNGDSGVVPVQPLDTFSSTDASKSSVPSVGKADSWMSSLPSEEEQLEMIREEEAWSTVQTKKATKGKKKEITGDNNDDQIVSKPLPVTPVVQEPVITKAPPPAVTNGKPTKSFSQKSSFAALSTNDEPDVEEEWDV